MIVFLSLVINMERYIGITGFKTKEEIDACIEESSGKEPMIMYGILTSPKNFSNIAREGSRRPAFINLASLLEYVPKSAMPTIHHCSNNRQISSELDTLLIADDIYDRGLCKAIQINQRLPDVKEIKTFKKKYSDIKIILQLEPEDIADPKATGQIVNNYEGLVEYVIIDPSKGIGKELNVYDTLKVLNNLKINAMPVIAGGLSAENVGAVVKFFRKEYGDGFCIDVEGKIRDVEDKLSVEKMTSYIKEAYKVYR